MRPDQLRDELIFRHGSDPLFEHYDKAEFLQCAEECVKDFHAMLDVSALADRLEACEHDEQMQRVAAKIREAVGRRASARAVTLEKERRHLEAEHRRVNHIDLYFAEDKEALDRFVQWLRRNPYPD